MNDLYSILELDVHAKDEDIKKHFRKLSLKYHPDKNGSKEKLIELKDAYDILIDKEKRKISLSIKALEEKQTKEAVKKYGSKDSGGVLGEILGPLLSKKSKKKK